MFRRSAPLITAAVLVGLGLGWILHRPPLAVEHAPAQLPAIGLQQASIVLRHRGEKQAEVRADWVEVSRDLRYVMFGGNPAIVVFSAGEDIFRIHGGRIVLDRHTSDVTVHGPVEVASPRGGYLRAGAASWINAMQRLVFEQGVTMTLDDQELTAEQVTIDVGQQVLNFSGGVDVAFYLEGAKP